MHTYSNSTTILCQHSHGRLVEEYAAGDQRQTEGDWQLFQPQCRPCQDIVRPRLTGSSGHDDDDRAGGWEVELLQQLPGCNWLEIWQLVRQMQL